MSKDIKSKVNKFKEIKTKEFKTSEIMIIKSMVNIINFKRAIIIEAIKVIGSCYFK